MTERLKAALDLAEDKPKLKNILLQVAAMPESQQDDTLDNIQAVIAAMRINPAAVRAAITGTGRYGRGR